VDAYPAITVIRKAKQGSVTIASAGPEVEKLSTKLHALIRKVTQTSVAHEEQGLDVARVDTWFQGPSPWPCHSPEQLALLRRIENAFAKLEDTAKVGIGVATGNDRIFVTKDSGIVETSRLLKLAMVKDIFGGALSWSGRFLVDPWDEYGLVDLGEYPKLGAYFRQHEAALRDRHTAHKSRHGWYKTIDRVTHSLAKRPKLYIADIKNVLDPVLDQGETYPHHNLYYIESSVWDLEVLGGLLLSAVGQFFVESYGVRMRGGYMRFQAQYLRRIRVPHPDALSRSDVQSFKAAFRSRDRVLATVTALGTYGIKPGEMEKALGHR
jgi:adenine-specific DNA-methyltransferase